jgi:aldehyde dehydrogenase (NAD+)
VERARALRVGNGLDESTEMGPQINEQQIETSARYVAIASQEGARLLTGGRRLTEEPAASSAANRGAAGANWSNGYFFAPTVFAGVTPEMRVAREEIFGPVVSLLECKSFDEAIEIANNISYGLSTALYSRDVNRALQAVRDLEAGITYINAPTIGAEVHLPFGGVKQTGNGHREGGAGAIDFYTTWKSVYIDYSDRLQRAQID